MKTDDTNSCKSVFKGATETAISEALTQRWIELINRLEKQKGAVLVRRS